MNLEQLIKLLFQQGHTVQMIGDDYIFTKEDLETILSFVYTQGYADCVEKWDLKEEYFK